MTTLTKTGVKPSRSAPNDYPNGRRVTSPGTPYRHGFDDCLHRNVYANPYTFGTAAADEYQRGNGDGRLVRYQKRTCLRVDETAELDHLLTQRGLTAQIERVSLQTGSVVRRFTIGSKSDVES